MYTNIYENFSSEFQPKPIPWYGILRKTLGNMIIWGVTLAPNRLVHHITPFTESGVPGLLSIFNPKLPRHLLQIKHFFSVKLHQVSSLQRYNIDENCKLIVLYLQHLSLRVIGQKICGLLQPDMMVNSPCLQLLNSILRKSTLVVQQKFTHPALDHAAEILQLDNLGRRRRANWQPCFSLGSSQRDSLSVSDGERSRLTTEQKVTNICGLLSHCY